jgi:4-hydroxy 2-oxovalerate aldolase
MDSISVENDEQRSLTLLDCTLRDGGYINGHNFSPQQIETILAKLIASGVDVIELGYFRRRNLDRHLTTISQCPNAFLCSLMRHEAVRYGVMIPPADVEVTDLDEIAELPVSVVRVTCTEENLKKVVAIGERAKRVGLMTCVNLTRVSERTLAQLAQTARELSSSGFDILYAADSNGALYPGEVTAIIRELRNNFAGQLGFHAHDSLRLAVANAFAAMSVGASWLDGTIGGVGKGGGNAAIEVLLAQASKTDRRAIDIAGFSQVQASFSYDFFPVRFKEKLENIFYGQNNWNIDKIKSVESIKFHL